MYEVRVTRKGQTTIPVELRKKYNIREGTRLLIVDTGDGILLKPLPTIEDLAGSGSKHANPSEMKEILDKLRSEDYERI